MRKVIQKGVKEGSVKTGVQNSTQTGTRFGGYYSGDTIPFQVRVFERTTNEYHIYLSDIIEEMIDVEQAITTLYEATENDEVIIHLNSSGGSHYAGDALIHAIKSCKAHVHTIGTGRIASYATFVLLSADSFELSPFVSILLHSCSYGTSGKSQDILDYVNFTHEQTTKLLKHYYKGFLTKKEIKHLIENRHEMLMDAEEFTKRFNGRNKKMEKKMQKQQQAIESISKDEDLEV